METVSLIGSYAISVWSTITSLGWIPLTGLIATIIISAVAISNKIFTYELTRVERRNSDCLSPTGGLSPRTPRRSLERADGELNEPLSLLPDEDIASTFTFRSIVAAVLPFGKWFWDWKMVGVEKLPVNSGAFLITIHTTHNHDIFLQIGGMHAMTGRVVRSLLHRDVMTVFPLMRFLGSVPGYRNTAYKLLTHGFWVAAIPGGVEEAMVGHEHAYNFDWGRRKGFAVVAQRAGVPIVPCFIQNGEEMKWNPIFALWNLFQLGKVYDMLCKFSLIRPVIKLMGRVAWFCGSWFGIWVPVRATTFIGDPIVPGKDEPIDEIVQRARVALADLRDKCQPYGPGKNYTHALKQRWLPSYGHSAGMTGEGKAKANPLRTTKSARGDRKQK